MEYDTLEGTGVDLILTKPYTTTQLQNLLGRAAALIRSHLESEPFEGS